MENYCFYGQNSLAIINSIGSWVTSEGREWILFIINLITTVTMKHNLLGSPKKTQTNPIKLQKVDFKLN